MKHLILIVSAVLCMAYFSACSSDEPGGSNPRHDIELDATSRGISDELNTFYVKFTHNACNYVDSFVGAETKNVVTSPLSISMVLSMVANSVTGDLQQEIIDYLGVNNLEGVNSLASTLLASLPNIDKGTTLTLANSVWVNSNYSVKSDYVSLINGNYDGTVSYFDVSNPSKAVSDINSWCAKKTNNLITNYFNEIEINPYTYAFILNAMYFKAKWATDGFFTESNLLEKFYGMSGIKSTQYMESKSSDLAYQAGDGFEYVRLPFGNGAFNLCIVLPNEDVEITDMSSRLTPEVFAAMEASTEKYSIKVKMPKFKFAQKLDLNSIVKACGLEHISDLVELTMFEDSIKGSTLLKQATSIEVNEKGAEAAAVSSAELVDSAPFVEPPLNLIINRPFLFFITECSTGTCLISGRLADV